MAKIEILAPVGSEEMLRAAVFSGADAVYLGFSGFNARTGAGNFDADSLQEAVRFCHARGVAVHVALNTTVYGTELPALEQAIRDGAPIAEIDEQQLSDGTLIVMHDSNFKRTTGEDICVWDVEADALKTLEVGSGFSAAYRGEQLPTLEEMLTCARGRITLMIELKSTGQEDALEESVLTLLQD